jgi:two-component system response regulator MprA
MKEKILVVDDDAVIRKALSESLSFQGFEVCIAQNGQEGLNVYRREKPDLIILDLVMPVMSGVECLEQIRAEDTQVPVLVLTGYGTEDQLERLKSLGVSDVIRKAIGFEDFLNKINQVIRSQKNKPLGGAREPSEIKILVADDDAVIRTLLVEFLTGKGFMVLSAKDGEETLDVISKHQPDIVFLDLVMPKKDGRAVLDEVSPEISSHIRWVLLTGQAKTRDLSDIETEYRVLHKPFSLDLFEKTISDILKNFLIKI